MFPDAKKITNRLKALAKRIERLEPNSLSGLIYLTMFEQWVAYAESIAPPQGRSGAPKKWTASQEDDWLRLVQEIKRRRGIETDIDALIFVFHEMLGETKFNARRSAKKFQNRISAARNRSQ